MWLINLYHYFFGDGYDKTIFLTQILSSLVIIIGISHCLGSEYYNPAGLRSKSAKFVIIGSCVNLILNLILIPRFWSYGAAIATIIAETVISILYLKYCNEFFSFKKLFKFSWKKIISGLIMFICVYFIAQIKINDILSIGIQVTAGIIIYCIVLVILKDDFINIVKEQVLNKKLKAKRDV